MGYEGFEMIKRAEELATRYHDGQYRKNRVLPYIVHPKSVADRITQYGLDDPESIAIAWLHDTIEDTPLTYDQIKDDFGKKVADGVYLLTRNIGNDEYKRRLRHAPDGIKLIKLCDTLDNITTLDDLSSEGIERKINDCLEFYIPLAKSICPEIARQMKHYVSSYIWQSVY